MKSLDAFADAFLNMYLGQIPEREMVAEMESPVDRYVGPGPETYYYSIRIRETCHADKTREVVRREKELALSRGRERFEWKVFDVPGVERIDEELMSAGFKLQRQSRLLFHGSDFSKENPNVTVKQVRTDDDFDRLLDINAAAFNHRSDWLNRTVRKEMTSCSPFVRAFLSYVGGKPACAGWVKLYNGVGYLFGGGTVPELRGKGAYRALVSARAAFAREKKVPFIASECSPDSERVLNSIKFTNAGKACQWVYPKADPKLRI